MQAAVLFCAMSFQPASAFLQPALGLARSPLLNSRLSTARMAASEEDKLAAEGAEINRMRPSRVLRYVGTKITEGLSVVPAYFWSTSV